MEEKKKKNTLKKFIVFYWMLFIWAVISPFFLKEMRPEYNA